MLLKIAEFTAVVLAALVSGMFFGPWLALSRSLAGFDAAVFVALVKRLNSNMASVMTILMPAAIVSVLPVMWLSRNESTLSFAAAFTALVLLLLALYVTMAIEVPLVLQMSRWTTDTLPRDWTATRDRWLSYHEIRVVAGFLAFVALLGASVF